MIAFINCKSNLVPLLEAWVVVYSCECPSAASGDSLVPTIQHIHQCRVCTSMASSEQRFVKTDTRHVKIRL